MQNTKELAYESTHSQASGGANPPLFAHYLWHSSIKYVVYVLSNLFCLSMIYIEMKLN